MPAPDTTPTVAVVFLLPACNMDCSFCVTEDDFESIDPSRLDALLAALAIGGTRTVIFGGGEPFLWKGDLLAAADRAHELGLLVQVGTNGTRLPDGFETLGQIDRWVLPIESTDPTIHDSMRVHRSSHHARILDRLERLGRARREVTLSTVLAQPNTPGLVELGRWIRAYHGRHRNVHAWHLYRFLPLGRGGTRHREELEIPPADYDRAAQAVLEMDLPFRVFRRSDMYHSATVDFFWQENGRILRGGDTLAQRADTSPI